jgi:hypothetical protein
MVIKKRLKMSFKEDLSEEAPNFRIVRVCRNCKYLGYNEKAIPQQSRFCKRYGHILSNYMGDFYVCDSFKDVEDE